MLSYRSSVSARLIYAFGGVILVFGLAVTLSVLRLASFNDAVSRITGPMLTQLKLPTPGLRASRSPCVTRATCSSWMRRATFRWS